MLNLKTGTIELGHGSGGRASTQLIQSLFHEAFHNEWLLQNNDQACFTVPQGRMVMSTDAFVVHPIFFPGGNIGSLAVHGTVNDLAMAGARPAYLSVSFILEEGFPLRDLHTITHSMAEAARQANVNIITGDTKVVEKGKGDGVFITTTGVGFVPEGLHLSGDRAQVGDDVLINGWIGDHGFTLMAERQKNLFFQHPLSSDTCSLHDIVATMIQAAPELRCMRDPTRGGVACSLNEWAHQSKIGIVLQEDQLPIRPEVLAGCEYLGLDPLNLANEGKLLAICPPQQTAGLLHAMQQHPLGQHAKVIGQVIHDPLNLVQLKTHFGGHRVVDWLFADPFPRIC
jgi:hydrogenase expression/formation protein HypE